MIVICVATDVKVFKVKGQGHTETKCTFAGAYTANVRNLSVYILPNKYHVLQRSARISHTMGGDKKTMVYWTGVSISLKV